MSSNDATRKHVFATYIARLNATSDKTSDLTSGYLICYRNVFGTLILTLLIISALISVIYIAVNPDFSYAKDCRPANETATPTLQPNDTTTPASTSSDSPTPTPTEICKDREPPLALRIFSAFIPLVLCIGIFVIALLIWTNRKPPSILGILQIAVTGIAAIYSIIFGAYLCFWGCCGPPLFKVLCFIWPSLFMGSTAAPAMPESLAVIQRVRFTPYKCTPLNNWTHNTLQFVSGLFTCHARVPSFLLTPYPFSGKPRGVVPLG